MKSEYVKNYDGLVQRIHDNNIRVIQNQSTTEQLFIDTE